MKALSIALFDDRDPHELLRWGIAGALILAAHAGLIATYMLLRKPDPVAAGAPVVLLELAPAPAAPEIAQTEPQQPEPKMEKVEQPPEPEVAQPPVEEPPPPPPIAKAEVVEPPPVPPPPVKAEVVPDPPKPKPKVEPERKKPPAPKTTTGAQARAEAKSASAPRTGASGSSAVSPDWQSLLSAHIRRHTRYPSGVQVRGITRLTITMDRAGRVLARSVAQSSGNSTLDAEALATIARAQPLPAFPPSMTQARMTVNVPINFTLAR
jgi:protein TonB